MNELSEAALREVLGTTNEVLPLLENLAVETAVRAIQHRAIVKLRVILEVAEGSRADGTNEVLALAG